VKVLLLGGTEFFAPFVADELLARGHTAAVLSESDYDFGEGVQRFTQDPRDPSAAAAVVTSWKAEAVIDMLHDRPEQARLTVQMCQGLVQRSVHLSSAAVYGPNPTCPIDETTDTIRPDQASPPAAAQIQADEAVLAAIAGGLPATILRMPHLYGPRDPLSAEWFFAKRALDGRTRIAVPDAGLHICHRGFVQNMAWGVVRALTAPRAAGQVYNLGEEKLYTLAQLARAVARALDHQWDIYSVPGDLWTTPYDTTAFYDLRKARAQLRYRDTMIPRDGLEITLGWLCQQPRGDDWRWPAIDHPFDYAREDALIDERGRKLDL